MSSLHSNAGNGSVAVTAAGSAVTVGKPAGRTHEHVRGTLVIDSPPYVPGCAATKVNGDRCGMELNGDVVKLSGLCPSHMRAEAMHRAT